MQIVLLFLLTLSYQGAAVNMGQGRSNEILSVLLQEDEPAPLVPPPEHKIEGFSASLIEMGSTVANTADPVSGVPAQIRQDVDYFRWLGFGLLAATMLFALMDLSSLQKQPEKQYASVSEEGSNLLQKIGLTWIEPLLRKGLTGSISDADLGKPLPEAESTGAYRRFAAHWQAEKAAHGDKATLENAVKNSIGDRKFKFILTLQITWYMIKYVLYAVMLGKMVTYISGGELSPLEFQLTCAAFVIVPVVGFAGEQWWMIECYRINAELISGLAGAVYDKALHLPAGNAETSSGEIVNLLSADLLMFCNAIDAVCHVLASIPTCVVLLGYLWSCVGAVALMVFVMTVACLTGISTVIQWMGKINANAKMKQDKRMKLVNDALSGIRIVKAYAWEGAMGKSISEMRSQELLLVRDNQVANAMLTAVFFLVPKFIPAGVFVMFHVTGGQINAPIIFITLALGAGFNACLLMLPGSLMGITQMQAAMGRLENFLKMPERSSDTDENSLQLPASPTEPAVSMTNCTFQWPSEAIALENIDLKVQPGELLMIIGKVGSGKSALLNAILGELNRTVGKLETRGSLSYACQEPWLFEGTLQQNVVFSRDSFDQARYQKVIEACALESDIKQFPGGDQVEIGARGVVLSGGQKARVGLARAVYHNADIVVMDDPLAAVDVHVGAHLFSQVLQGQLAGKTRILVTNQTQYASKADRVLLIDSGKLVAVGTYEELRDKYPDRISAVQAKDKSTENSEKKEQIEGEAAQLRVAEAMETSSELRDDVMSFYISMAGKPVMAAVLAALFVQVITLFGSDFVLACWMDYRTSHGSSFDSSWVAFYLTILGICMGMGYINGIVGGKVAWNAGTQVHDKLLDSVLRAPLGWYDQNPLGRALNRFTTDLQEMDLMLMTNLRSKLCMRLTIFSMTVMALVTTGGLISLVLIPTVWVGWRMYKLYRGSILPLRRIMNVKQAPVTDGYSTVLNGLATVRAFKKEQFQIDVHHYNWNNFFASSFLSKAGIPCWIYARFFAVLLVNVLALTGIFAAHRDSITPGLAGFGILIGLSMLQQLWFMIQGDTEADLSLSSVERLKSFCDDLPAEAPANLDADPDMTQWPTRGEVVLEDLRLGYRDGPDVLKSISAKINPGEKVGVVGRTGSGKSTTTLALLRLVERRAGRIVIDGVDTKTIGLDCLRKSVGLVPQDPVLFVGTLRSNLDPFDEFTDDEIWHALGLTEMSETIAALDGGLEFETAEGGENFSAGQRQLLCLARVLLRKPKVLLMDEATAHLDNKTDSLIQKAIRTHFKDCTVIAVAHRLETVLDCDRVLVFDDGNLAENGSPKDLLANPNGKFAGMVARKNNQ